MYKYGMPLSCCWCMDFTTYAFAQGAGIGGALTFLEIIWYFNWDWSYAGFQYTCFYGFVFLNFKYTWGTYYNVFSVGGIWCGKPNSGVEAATRIGTYWARSTFKQKFLFYISPGAQINFFLQFSIDSCIDMTLCLVFLHGKMGLCRSKC